MSNSMERLVQLVFRPLLLMFWAAVVWGTFLFAALLFRMANVGAGPALRALIPHSGDALAWLNLASIPLALVVWTLAAVAGMRLRGARPPSVGS